MPRILIREDMCKGCGLCVAACPRECIKIASHVNAKGYNPASFVAPEKCTGCANCAVVCPDVVIEVYREAKEKEAAAK